jgi:carboxynorspermidine decarboxylase
VTVSNFREDLLDGVSGLHFHTLCEQNADALIKTLDAFENKFGKYLSRMEWVNFGGGHHITRADYDVEALVRIINDFKAKYGVEVYLEPGEAVALNTGYLVSTVLDIVDNDIKIAILDTSAACHMPDVLEMPYRPNVLGSGFPKTKKFDYRFGGPTCLAGDIIGDYSFDTPLNIGDKLVFCDMAIYTMVKNNTFNGMNLPSIAIIRQDSSVVLVKSFGYDDFRGRLS